MAFYTVSVRLDDSDKEQAKLIEKLREYPRRSAQRKVELIECLVDAFVYKRKSVRDVLSGVEARVEELARIQAERKDAPVIERVIEKVVQAPTQINVPRVPMRREVVTSGETSALLGEDALMVLAREAFE